MDIRFAQLSNGVQQVKDSLAAQSVVLESLRDAICNSAKRNKGNFRRPNETEKRTEFKKEIPAKVRQIQAAVAEAFGLNSRDLEKVTRVKSIALPRQIAMYLVRIHTQLGFKEIGSYFGGRDHTTVLHACQKVEKQRSEDQSLGTQIVAVEDLLQCA